MGTTHNSAIMKGTATAPRIDRHGLAYYGLDDDGQVFQLKDGYEWEAWDEAIRDHQRIVKSSGTKEVGVVTEFFGRTQRFSPNGEPYLWYTIVIKPVEFDDAVWKTVREYSTREDAEKGHNEVLRQARKAIAEGKDPYEVFSDLHS